MVFFTCAGCGESLKKAQVEKHRFRCRRSQLLTCIDCCKDFHNEEYQTHLKCISEDQKYGGQNYVAKENKGEVKQQKWFDLVQQAIDKISQSPTNGDKRLRDLLINIRNYPNIPQKEKKFKNFVANSLKMHDQALVTRAWKAIKSISDEIRPAPSTVVSTTATNTTTTTMNNQSSTSTTAAPDQSSSAEASPVVGKKKRKKTDSQSETVKKAETSALVAENGAEATSLVENRDENEPVKKKKKSKKGKDSAPITINESELSEESKKIEPPSSEQQQQQEMLTENSTDNNVAADRRRTVIEEENILSSEIVGDKAETTSLKSLVKKLLKEAENEELTVKRLKKLACKSYGYETDDQKRLVGEEIDAFLRKNVRKYATDGKIVRFAAES